MIQQVTAKAALKNQKLLFVDAGVFDVENLLSDLQPDFTVIPLPAESNPILQISAAISSCAPVSEIVILAHAEPGQIVFANRSLDLIALGENDYEITNWRNGLTEDAKICIYGCRLAYGDVGQAFIQKLAFLTGAKVASSTLPIGNLGARQNWELDSFTRSFEVLIPFHPNSRMGYPHRLEPLINISGGSKSEGAAGDRYIVFVVTLSEPATSNVDFWYRTLSSASTGLTGNIDFNGGGSTFARIPAGETSITFSIGVTNDALDEADESVVVELFNPVNAVFPDGASTLRATGVILDDDGVGNNQALFVSHVQLVEGDGNSQQAVFEVQLSRVSLDPITLNYTTANGSALAGQDYQALRGSLTFAPGETRKSVAVPLIGDAVAENNEFFNLVLTPTNEIANGVEGAVGTAVIQDDDSSAILPEISISGGKISEAAGLLRSVEFTVTLSEPATSNVDFWYRTLSSASTGLTGNIDFNGGGSTFARIPAGETSITFSIGVTNDALDEADESVVVELFNPVNAVFPDGVNTLQAIGLIHDDDGAGNNLGLFVGNTEIVEGADGVTREVAVPIHLSRPSDQTLTFQYQTTDGSAIAGQDYTAQTGTVTFLPGQTSAAAIIPIIGDGIDEPSEIFSLTVTPTPEIANGSAGSTGIVTILDGDVLPPPVGITVSAGNNENINEGSLFTRTITFSDGEDSGGDGWTYSVDWGDGSAVENGVIAAGANTFDINRFFADGDASHTVSVTVTDAAGDSDTQQFQLNVNNVAPTIALLGADSVPTGVSYTLNLGAITDPGQDTVTSYIVNWGDGSSETFSSAGDVTHVYTTAGNTTITVDLVDEDGTHINAGSLAVAVSTLSAGVSLDVGENASLNEGSLFSRTITFSDGEDTGGDGWTFSVDWSDGSAVELGNIAAGVNSFDISRFFADGDASHTVNVTVTDITGDTDTRQFVLSVNNVAPVMTLIGNASVDEGSAYTLTGSVFDPGMDTITSYIINWGDGTTTTLTEAEVQALSGNVTHVYADGASNPLISVDLVDEDGTHAAAGTLSVTVNNVAPTIALSGAAEVNAGDSYTLNLGAITDPGDDTVTNYIVNWGDGNVETFSAAGDVTHVYATTGNNTISVDLVDEDGMHTNAGSLVVMINDIVSVETVRIGDAPARITNLSQLVDAWSDPLLGNITHKSNATNLAEAWSTVALTTLNSLVLAGGDLYAGDLGVSGRSVATSTVAQELDGTETLRFEFTEEATAITVNLSRLYSNDSGSAFNESGRMRLLDSNDNVVGETTFVADALNGPKTISLASDTKFTAVEFNAGAYDGDLFIYGALADDNGEFGTGIYADTSGKLYGSDFLVDWIEPTFEISLIGTTTDHFG